ncbi:DUF4179 domain-containing protein [Anoxybacteroides tepidamans]|uniref:DUF4179 domain-containing protein n=1 Tax=Anoxybacteroides tepidamans TaxID=265948 RepID=UPI0005526907|nr:DUF4179 domain-containing protein [Anoxybacillus tepidamans]
MKHDDLFKQEVKTSLDHIKVPESIFSFAKELPYKMEEKPSCLSNRSKWRQWTTAAAVTLAVGVSAGTYISPTFAAYIQSFFTRPELDNGLQAAAKQGFSEKTNAAVTDQGITLKVKEVMADANRLILTYSLEKENGGYIDPTILFNSEQQLLGRTEYFVKDFNTFYITDEDGNIVSRSINYMTKEGKDVTQYIQSVFPHEHYADLMFLLDADKNAKQLFANIRLNKIGIVQGKWNLKVPIHIEKSATATKNVPIHQRYTTKDGISITLQNIVHSPTLTAVHIETKWTETGMQRNKMQREYSDGNGSYFYRPVFDILDSKGNVVATTESSSANDPKRPLFIETNSYDPRTTTPIQWNYSFLPLSKGEKLTFAFRGIKRIEFPNKAVTIDLAKLKKHPVSLSYKDNNITIRNFKWEKNQKGERVGVLDMEETTAETIDLGVSDSQQKQYILHTKDPLLVTDARYNPDTMMYHIKSRLEIEGMDKAPSSLTLTIKSATVLYKDADWKINIVQ